MKAHLWMYLEMQKKVSKGFKIGHGSGSATRCRFLLMLKGGKVSRKRSNSKGNVWSQIAVLVSDKMRVIAKGNPP